MTAETEGLVKGKQRIDELDGPLVCFAPQSFLGIGTAWIGSPPHHKILTD